MNIILSYKDYATKDLIKKTANFNLYNRNNLK